jgi:hypothetical protein
MQKIYSILNNKQTNTFVAMSIEEKTEVYSLSPHISNEYFAQAMQEALHEDSEWTLASKDERTTLYTKLNSNNNGSEVSQRQEFKFVSHFPYNWRELFETIRDVTVRKEAAKQNLEQIKWIENHASYVIALSFLFAILKLSEIFGIFTQTNTILMCQ